MKDILKDRKLLPFLIVIPFVTDTANASIDKAKPVNNIVKNPINMSSLAIIKRLLLILITYNIFKIYTYYS